MTRINEMELRTMEHCYSSILNSISSDIVILNIKLEVVYWNREELLFSGLSIHKAGENSIFNLFPYLRGTVSVSAFTDSLNGSIITRSKIPYKKAGGESGYLDLKNTPLKNREGEILGVISQLTDVTEIVKLKERLLWNQKIEYMGILNTGLVHELNNLFTILMGNIALFEAREDRYDKGPIINSMIKIIEKGEILTRQLLQFSRKKVQMVEVVDLKPLIEGCLKLLKGTMQQSRIRVNLSLEKAVIKRARVTHLQQMIFNLVLNAEKAIVADGNLEIKLSDKKDRIRIAVIDNGPGIPKEISDCLFEPFITLGKDDNRSGNGLGLFICRDIVHRHRGNIKVRSRLKKGTAFIINLPKDPGGKK